MLKRFEWLFWGVVLISLLLSCVPEKGSEDYLAPEIVSAEAIVADRSVSLSCELSSPRVQTCGFVLWTGNQEKKILTCDLSSTSFSAVVSDLSPGMTYEWYAFANAGEIEIHSDTRRFATMEIIPAVKGIDIPDPYFKQYLLDNFDANGDGILSEMEGLIIRKIDVVTDKISSMKGIEHFKNLDSLICRGTAEDEDEYSGHPGLLDSLDLKANRKLRYLACDGNMIRSLDIRENTLLEELRCGWNLLESLDLSGSQKLKKLIVPFNSISSLDFSNCPDLIEICCSGCALTELDISMLTHLRALDCSPMDDAGGVNLLRRIRFTVGQMIPNVTVGRNPQFVPDGTEVVAESLTAGVEGYGGGEYDP